ncbi:hypothetical protein DFQ26_009134 [Actinomortierella ambigua]|nr:hypothetical protein DFQ26_009134 [Actinomortierella ambigua]
MSLIGSVLDPLLPDQTSTSQPAPTTPPPVVTTTPPQPTTTNDPPPPVVTTTSILNTIPSPDPPVQTTPPQPIPDTTTKGPRPPQQTTTRGGGGNGGGGGNNGGNSRPIGPTPSIGPSSGVTGPSTGTSADVQRDTSSAGSGSTATIIGTLVGVAAAIVLILAGLLVWRKRQQKRQSFEALFGSSSLAAASGLNNDSASVTGESTKPIYGRNVEEGYLENKAMASPPPLTALEPSYGGEQNYYQQHPSSAMSPVSASATPQAGYEHYDPYYQQGGGGGEAYNMQEFNAYNQGAGGYEQYDYGHYGDYPATSTAGPAATGAHQDDMDSLAYYPYDQSGGAQGQGYSQQQQPSYGRRP